MLCGVGSDHLVFVMENKSVFDTSKRVMNPYMSCVETNDVYEHARHLSGWRLSYDQLSAGQFHGELTEVCLDTMQLVRDRSNQAMKKTGAAAQGSLAFSLNFENLGDVYCSGHLVSDPSLLVARSDYMPELKVPNVVDVLLIAVDEKFIQQTLESQGSRLQVTDVPSCYGVSGSPELAELKWLTHQLFNGELGETGINQASIRNDIRDTVTLSLIDMATPDENLSLKPTARKRTVDRACEYAMAHLHEPFSILDLCNSIGASRRKLQYSFQDALGINPVAYLRALRLNAVRRELKRSAFPCAIQDVAGRWGFWHMGRFSVEYRTMFGERPSDTLNRKNSFIKVC